MASQDTSPAETTLVLAARAGDARAWTALFEGHAQPLYGYIAVRVPDRHLAEEIAQDCWLVAVRRLGRFDPGRGSFWSWMRGIADKQLLNAWRRWRRRGGSERPLTAALEPETVDPAGRTDVREELALALSRLPPRYQAALQARYRDGASVAEIAAGSGDSPKAVESLLSRARAALRQILENPARPSAKDRETSRQSRDGDP